MAEKPSYSNGVAYADLDQDGDLDLVVNNINEKAFILENTTNTEIDKHYLRLKLNGLATNPKAIGAKITLWQHGRPQRHFQSVVRGYLSSMEPIVHFGVSDGLVDSLKIIWPNGRMSLMKDIKVDQVLTFDIESAKNATVKSVDSVHQFKLNVGFIDFVHDENSFNEYNHQGLLVRQYSQFGPCVAVSDVDGRPGD